MEISVIVPVYKAEMTLQRCADSLLCQTATVPFEVILVDDGSPDASGQMCDAFAERDERVRVIHQKNGGCLEARRTGLKAARGKYIAFVDSDDWVEPDYLQVLYEPVCQGASVVAGTSLILESKNGQMGILRNTARELLITKQQFCEKLYPGLIYNGRPFGRTILASLCSKLFKKELLEAVLYQTDGQIAIGEDVSITYPALIRADAVAQVNVPVYHYWQSEASMTHNYVPTYLLQARLLQAHLKRWMVNEQGYDFTAQIDGNYISMLVSAVSNLFQKNAPVRKVQKQTLREICQDADCRRILRNFDASHFNRKEQIVCWLLRRRCHRLLYLYEKMIQIVKKHRQRKAHG